MEYGEIFTTDGIWGGTYNGWNSKKDLQQMEYG
jgi:hypothetical protein